MSKAARPVEAVKATDPLTARMLRLTRRDTARDTAPDTTPANPAPHIQPEDATETETKPALSPASALPTPLSDSQPHLRQRVTEQISPDALHRQRDTINSYLRRTFTRIATEQPISLLPSSLLVKLNDPKEHKFYTEQGEQDNWTTVVWLCGRVPRKWRGPKHIQYGCIIQGPVPAAMAPDGHNLRRVTLLIPRLLDEPIKWIDREKVVSTLEGLEAQNCIVVQDVKFETTIGGELTAVEITYDYPDPRQTGNPPEADP